MKLRREYRDRDSTEVAILEALADRYDEGMTVFELRSRVGTDIDDLESALSSLQADGLIVAADEGDRTIITIEERILVTESGHTSDGDPVDWLRERLGL